MTASPNIQLYDLNIEQILLKAQVAFPKVVGVYFLLAGPVVVYVGQSKDILVEIIKHSRDSIEIFDRFAFIECPEDHLEMLLTHFVKKFRPPLNIDPKASKNRNLLQKIKTQLGIPIQVLQLWMRHKGPKYSLDGYDFLIDFANFGDFVMWMHTHYPGLPNGRWSTLDARTYLQESSESNEPI